MWVYNTRLQDFLAENGLDASFELYGMAYYKKTRKLNELLTRYTIIHSCFNGYKT